MHKLTLYFILSLFFNCDNLFSQVTEDARLANEYYQQGEIEKAKSIYNDLKSRRDAIPLIHSNYFNLLLAEQNFSEAEKYLTHALRVFPKNLQYETNLINVYSKNGESNKKDRYINQLMKEYEDSPYQLASIAQNLISQSLYNEALSFLKEARKITRTKSAYALDMAAVYRMKNDKSSMIEEYLNYALDNPMNINYVKNIFQNFLKEEDELDHLETTLIKKVQDDPDNTLYIELLIWVELQRKNFYGAFVQARSLDRRQNLLGDETMRIGFIAMDNAAWDEAEEIFEYVISHFRDSHNSRRAKKLVIQVRENKVKNSFPVNPVEIKQLIQEYADLIKDLGINPITLEAMRNKALLHAFYLDEMDSSITILKSIIENPRAPRTLISQSKLDLGDIYLLVDMPWESTLLYSQVEKSDKESILGYEAKLRNARLNYFTGNFSLAKNHLDILKLATTREISNDAIAMSLLISNNTAFDTTDQVMQKFADIELLIFQNKNQQAIDSLTQFLTDHPTHSLVDETYWLLADLQLRLGDFSKSIEYLEKIYHQFEFDIIADDAMYKKAQILEEQVGNREEAQAMYQEFLSKFPGSIFAAEARNKIRKLRGDFIN